MYNDTRALHSMVEDRQKSVRKAAQDDRNFRIATGKPLHKPKAAAMIATLLVKAIGMGG